MASVCPNCKQDTASIQQERYGVTLLSCSQCSYSEPVSVTFGKPARRRPLPKIARAKATAGAPAPPGGMVVYLDGETPPAAPAGRQKAKDTNRKPPPGRVFIQHELPLMPGRHTQKIEIPEETIQRQTIDTLTAAGYIVKQTSVRFPRQQCPKCFFVFWFNPLHKFNKDGTPKGYGASKGVTDLLVRNPHWPESLWCTIEIKGTDTPLSEKQQELYNGFHIVVFKDSEDALAYVKLIDAALLPLRNHKFSPIPENS